METVTNHEFTVIASAPYAEDVEATFTITIGIAFDTNTSLAQATQGSEYFGVVSATGATNVKYSLKEGSELPEGLTLNANGEIEGTPTTAGIYRFTVVAERDGKLGDELELTFYVANVELTWWQKLVQFFLQLFGVK